MPPTRRMVQERGLRGLDPVVRPHASFAEFAGRHTRGACTGGGMFPPLLLVRFQVVCQGRRHGSGCVRAALALLWSPREGDVKVHPPKLVEDGQNIGRPVRMHLLHQSGLWPRPEDTRTLCARAPTTFSRRGGRCP